ncbi:FAA hydrolase family protein [Robertmurraya yapensis]|uniref:FAA hydrolase family protein n=2 Tax=Bacillaceae TaxID=186817 RepID=A0A431W7N9_9BACI|nr:fumarylacetoacetate hydrolase family protein [Bacillus yapensis]RTR31492.1 FAA hydrolase family protein [Bacillus yapensis]TKS95716.1 fumarylacetoacetate hydrolase family protein [Bacillus yapensis]
MKFVTAEDHHGVFVGIIGEETDSVLPLKRAEEAWKGESTLPETLQECIALEGFAGQASGILQWSLENAEELFVKDATLLAPIPRPAKNIFCVGKNYAEHAIEMGSKDDIPEHVMVFTKAPTTVIGPNETVLNHKNVTEQLDYEGELAVVIGKKGKGIKREEALDYIFGYTIINDVTARDLQSRHKQFFIGKSLDTSCPMGPWIVHSSVIENPNELKLETRINDEVRQSSNTKNFIFPIEEVISVLSEGMTLEPGDIIATGTPAGVGKGFKPPIFLKSGDKMEVTVEKIGKLVNYIEE